MSEPTALRATMRLRFVERAPSPDYPPFVPYVPVRVLQQYFEGTKGGERWEGWLDVPLQIENSVGGSE